MPISKLNAFTHKVADLSDVPQMTSAEFKAKFDEAPEELRVFLNNQLDIIQLEYAKQADLDSLVIGQLPAGSMTASKITVGDAGNKFTGTDVETVLAELFQFADNVHQDWTDVIGLPLLKADTSAQKKSKTQTIKNDLATNLTAKGQTSVGTETLDALVDKVALVNTGKLYATGTFSSASAWNTLTINTLDFQPNRVIIRSDRGTYAKQFVYSDVAATAFNTLGIEYSPNSVATVVSWTMLSNGFSATFGVTQQVDTPYTWEVFRV